MKSKVFIIHGWTYSLDKWTQLCGLLRDEGIEVVQLKVPGLTEASKDEWDIAAYVSWLDDKLKGTDKPVIIGHSNGGRIALAYVMAHPGRLDRLILIDSAGLSKDDKIAQAKLKTLKGISKVGKPLGKIPFVKKAFYKLIGGRDYLDAPENMKQTMQNMLAADKLIDLGAIHLPVMIIWGENDTITPLKDGQAINRLINGSEMHVIGGARHAPQATHAEQVAQIIKENLSK